MSDPNDPKPLTREEVESIELGKRYHGASPYSVEQIERLCADWLRMEAAMREIVEDIERFDETGTERNIKMRLQRALDPANDPFLKETR